jgi:glycosyltransferase involved in cell wall biosynthesis
MRPTILFLEQQSWKGGAQQVLEAVIESLREDIECLVAFPNGGPFEESLRNDGIETAFYPLGNYLAGRKSWKEKVAFGPRTLACAARLTELVLERDVRLIYINGPRCLPAGTLAARLTGRPALFHLHQTLQRPMDGWIAAQTSRWVSKIVACSHAASRMLTQRRPELLAKVRVLYNPVRNANTSATVKPGLFSYPAGTKPFTVGIVGRVTPSKGFHVLIEAVARVSQHLRQNLRILAVGEPAPGSHEDAAYQRELISLISTTGLERETVWTGHLADTDPAYARMDVLVVPSISPEGLPLAALEALQHAVPVIASAAGGILEVVQDGKNGILVPPGDVPALAAALERIGLDPSLRQHLAEGSLATFDSRFAPETFKTDIRQTVLELASGSTVLNAQQIVGS